MKQLDTLALLTMTDAEIKQRFEEFVVAEEEQGLIDIKFAVASSPDSTVVDAMRQLMMIKSMRDVGQLQQYHD